MGAAGKWRADAVGESGDLDCGSGLLLILREALEPLAAAARLLRRG